MVDMFDDNNIPPYVEPDNIPEFHSVETITLGELIQGGWVDWNSEEWKFDSYSDEQHERLCKKIEDRYYFREIGVLPPARWKKELLRKLNEVMPKYKILYKKIEDGPDYFAKEDEFGKSRGVYSDFPATQLGGKNQDYATNGTDKEYETIKEQPYFDVAEKIAKRYNDVDVMILDDIESMFTCLVTVNMNGY